MASRPMPLFAHLTALMLLASCETPIVPAPLDSGRADAGQPADAGDAGADGDTWSSFAQAFFAEYCTDCHDAPPRDFRDLESVRANAATIRCGVSDVVLDGCGSFPPPRQFPIGTGPHPTDPERARLVAWIDDGMPD